MAANGSQLIFTSAANPVLANGDGNVELFVRTTGTGQVYQLTNTTSQPGFSDNTNAQTMVDGTRVVFLSRFALHSNGAQLAARDLFLADISYGGAQPAVTFRRLTTTGEIGPFALSGDGSTVILASKSALTGRNTFGKLQLFRITLSPAVTFSQLTEEPEGIAEHTWQLSLSVSYDGSFVAFHSDLNLDGDNNPHRSRQIFALTSTGAIGQFTDVPADRRASNPRITAHGDIVFTSNADLTGQNADGNTEIFAVPSAYLGTVQLTNTVGGDDGFGGANDDVSISPDGSIIVFNSNRDHVPAATGGPGNADADREIFMMRAALFVSGGTTVTFEQLTNTANPNPGTRFENTFPRTSSSGGLVAFNSDLDLGVAGSGLLYLATVPTPLDPLPPRIANVNPVGGGPGVPVALDGDHLARVTQVRFGALAASFVVLSNRRLIATVPAGIVDAPIVVVSPTGTFTTPVNFRAATFVAFGAELNQGLPSYQAVAGKDALIRLFAGASFGSWLVSDATLQINAPSGTVTNVGPSMYSAILNDMTQSFSEESNVNFYVPGSMLSESGTYAFTITVNTLGQTVHQQTFSSTLTPTRDVVMVFQSLFRHPDTDEWRKILRAFDAFSGIHPVRAGVGDLEGAIGADEHDAGLRVAYVNAPLFGEHEDGSPNDILCYPSSCWGVILGEMEALLAAVNSGGFEATEFATTFEPPDRLLTSDGHITDCDHIAELGAFGFARVGSPGAWVAMCADIEGSTLSHEIGHNMGLVATGSANSDGSGHSSTGSIAERGFVVRERRDVFRPAPVMWPVPTSPDWLSFFESTVGGQPADYPRLIADRTATGVAFENSRGEGIVAVGRDPQEAELLPPPGGPRVAILASIDSSGKLAIRHTFTADSLAKLTALDSSSRYKLVFEGRGGRILAEEAVPVRPFQVADGPRFRSNTLATLRAMRPLPEGTRAIEIRRDGTTIGRIAPGARNPILTLDRPTLVRGRRGMALRIQWTASDPDRDSLTHLVELSKDGIRWLPLGGLTRRQGLRIPVEGLPGGSAMRVRVTTSDGLHRARRVSVSFALPEHSPIVAIISPRAGLRVTEHDSVVGRAAAYDLDEGFLHGGSAASRFQWFVDGRPQATRAPNLGRGKLRPGRHVITLSVTDRSGRTGADTVWIEVERDSDKDGIPDDDERRLPDMNPSDPLDAGRRSTRGEGTVRDQVRAERLRVARPRTPRPDGD